MRLRDVVAQRIDALARAGEADWGLSMRAQMSHGLEGNDMSPAMALVRQGLGMTLLPESADEGRGDLVPARIEHPGVCREMGLITLAGSGLSPAAQRCVESIKNALPAHIPWELPAPALP